MSMLPSGLAALSGHYKTSPLPLPTTGGATVTLPLSNGDPQDGFVAAVGLTAVDDCPAGALRAAGVAFDLTTASMVTGCSSNPGTVQTGACQDTEWKVTVPSGAGVLTIEVQSARDIPFAAMQDTNPHS